MIGPISCVTVTVPDLAEAVAAYERYLGYRRSLDYRLPPEQATHFGAPALADAPAALLEPESGTDFHFRFVEQTAASGYRPLTTWGWNASELIVRDVDALAARLEDSPFRIAGPPEDLSFTSAIRAMQVIGPAGEVLYLTTVKEPLPEFDLPQPACDVDRSFIVILGGPDMAGMQAYYHRHWGVPEAPVMEARISVLSDALGLPPDLLHPIAALPLAGQSLIEVDAYPPGTGERAVPSGGLPPAMAMVSFLCNTLPDALPRARHEGAPYAGRESVISTGGAGELVEFIRA